MKLSFSTLGCPDWSFADMFSAAKDLGFKGIEVRGVADEIYTPKVAEFRGDALKKTMEKLKKANLELPIFTSGAVLSNKENIQQEMTEGYDYIDLAADAKVSYVRVLCDRTPESTGNIDIEFVTENLKEMCAYASSRGVTVLVETNGAFAKSSVLLELIKSVDSNNLGVIWDVHHTFRYFSEKPADTVAILAKYIKHVHLKDSIVKDGKIEYMMMGDGDIPLKDALIALKSINYTEYLSLEWVKRWSNNLAEAGIVFPQFVYYVRSMLKSI